MTNILSIPEELFPYLTFFQSSFSKPQFERFTEHLLSVIIDPRYTSNRIHKHFFHKVDQSTSNRFLTESPWNDEEVETRMFQLLSASELLPEYRIGALDDTLSHKKYAKKMEATIGEMCEYVKRCCETVSFHTVIRMKKRFILEENTMRNLGLEA